MPVSHAFSFFIYIAPLGICNHLQPTISVREEQPYDKDYKKARNGHISPSASEETAEAELSEAEKTETTNKEEIPGEQEETDETETTPPGNDKKIQGGVESD
jgi:hypothetical protein